MRVTWSGSKWAGWGEFVGWGYKGVKGTLKLLIKLKSKLSYNCGKEGCLDIFVLF